MQACCCPRLLSFCNYSIYYLLPPAFCKSSVYFHVHAESIVKITFHFIAHLGRYILIFSSYFVSVKGIMRSFDKNKRVRCIKKRWKIWFGWKMHFVLEDGNSSLSTEVGCVFQLLSVQISKLKIPIVLRLAPTLLPTCCVVWYGYLLINLSTEHCSLHLTS